MRRVVAIVVIVCLTALPAALAANLPQWTGCHGEAQITERGETITCVFDEAHLYQRVTYYVRTYSGAYVARIDLIELHHVALGKSSAVNGGLRDVDSLRRFYRTEYANQMKSTDDKGVERVSFITVYSGPEGFLVEMLTLIPVAVGPTVEGDEPTKEATL